MVVAKETRLQEILEGTKQYHVPLYQRTYSWGRKELGRLFDDVISLAEDRAFDATVTHFIGSIVLAPTPANGPAGVQEYLVVDGQQRLTTLSLLLAAIRDHRRETEDEMHFERINDQFLINKWQTGAQRLKLLPTQADRANYQACIDATPQAGAGDGVGIAYRFFRERLVEAVDPEDVRDIQRVEEAVVSGLALVCVTTSSDENVHRIFESLNNTGLKLTQGDLLRNYLFMRLPTLAEVTYSGSWLPLQERLTATELELLFWLDAVQEEPQVKQSDIYSFQVRRLDKVTAEVDIKAEVERLALLGGHLVVMLHPEQENDAFVRVRLARLKAWGTTTVYPLVLHLMGRRAQGDLSSADLATALLYVESYLVRRLLIGRTSSNINRTLLGAVAELRDSDAVTESLHRYLSSGRKYYGTDDEVAKALESTPFYLNGRATQRKLFLQWLEESYGSKEPVDTAKLAIEHVMPQTLTQEWREDLVPLLDGSESPDAVHTELLHTLGNLTLTGYNSPLSNKPYSTKRDLLLQSGLSMNREIAQQANWGPAQIKARAQALATRITSIWPGPVAGLADPETEPMWQTLRAACAAIPPGRWTTYGALAALIGSHPVPVGSYIANNHVPNAHRVLKIDGTPSEGFRWYENGREDDLLTVLTAEGINFDSQRHASAQQCLSTEGLSAVLASNAA